MKRIVQHNYFLPIAIEAFPDESAKSLLMRLAERNHLSHPKRLLELIRGSGPCDLLRQDLTPLSEICLCDPRDWERATFQVEVGEKGVRVYRLDGHEFSRDYFLVGRHARVCPECIAEFGYARQIWEIAFCVACPLHQGLLVDRCPACEQPIQGLRQSIFCCQCGLPLRTVIAGEASEFELHVAGLFWRLFGISTPISPPSVLPVDLSIRLASLSSDGLCKLLWYLGVYVRSLGKVDAGKARARLEVKAVRIILQAAFDLLWDWPDEYLRVLRSLQGDPRLIKAHTLMEQWFGSIRLFLANEMTEPEFAFVRSAFEMEMRKVWRTIRQSKLPEIVGRQLELEF